MARQVHGSPRVEKVCDTNMLKTPRRIFDTVRGKLRSSPAMQACPARADLRRLEDHLSIPTAGESADDVACDAAIARGQFLARQDRWEELSHALQAADSTREKTPGGTPVADLLAYGARADVVRASEQGIAEGLPANSAPLIGGILSFERIREGHRTDPMIALVIALAHIDIAWAWRGNGWDTILPPLNRARSSAHFDRAADLLAPHHAAADHSPILAAARCALHSGRRLPSAGLADAYEKLIDLDPENPRPMRSLGSHMLPQWFGNHARLELEARRTAARTQASWGAGGYTWVCFDAIAQDDGACAQVDVDYFTDGLQDIVRRRPDQLTINRLAAYCAVTLRAGMGLDEKADLARARICDAARWLIREHVSVLHPLIWAHAAEGFDNNLVVTSPRRFAARGRADAIQAIAEQFREEIREGFRVTFTEDGPQFDPT
ncbi:hypothetical protein ACFORG_17545 [Lutimaribacter marinistellae]|uniref:DUF4034 domain-containing protein n=1 Tax=Lutimaribacter marinistellae TaxID=1820329 RepID=A0ABV7TM14_9RHOB